MSEFPIEWIASFIAISTSTFRAFNLGYQAESYIISIFTYIIFMIHAEKKTQKILNVFYIFTALIGAYSHGFTHTIVVDLEKITPFILISFALSFSIFIIKTCKKLVKIHRKKE